MTRFDHPGLYVGDGSILCLDSKTMVPCVDHPLR